MEHTSKMILLSVLLVQSSLALELPRISVRAVYVGPHRSQVGATRSIPSQPIYAYRGHDYSLEISLTASPGVSLEPSRYAIICLLPNGSPNYDYLDLRKVRMISSTESFYFWSFTTEQETDVDLFLTWREEVQKRTLTPNTAFREASNRVKVHLKPPAEASPAK